MTDRNTKITTSQIADGTLLPTDLNATNSPVDNYVISYDEATGKFEWVVVGGISQLSDLSDVGVTTPTDKNVLVADGDSWESRALVEADISDLGTYLENLLEDTTPQLGGDLDLNTHNIDFPSVANVSDVKDEDDMASDSATMLATQQSIKKYVDNLTGIDDFTIKRSANKLKIADRVEQNIMLNAFRIAVNGGLVKYNMVDGITDEFEDESGIDLDECILETYDPTNDLFTTYLAEFELDYMEYSSDALAQSAYKELDVCTGGTATANNSEGESRNQDKAFDDNEGTYWSSYNSTFPSWIKYDLGVGVTKTVTILRMKHKESSTSYTVKDFTFEGSNNDADWDTLYTGQSTDDENWKTFDISESAQDAYRYYRLTVTSGWEGQPWVGIYEIEMIESAVIPYSESTIKQQGSYSLKCIADQTDSLNKTLTKDLDTNIDLTNVDELKFYVYASRTGTNIQLQIHDSGGTTSTKDVVIESGEDSAWKLITWDISGVSNANKDDIDQLIIKVINADAENTFYIDDWIVPERKNDLTLVSKGTTAEASPDNARIIIFEEDTDSVTINTDLKVYVTREYGSGCTWAEVTLVDEGDYATNKRVLSAVVDLGISGMGAGTNMAYKIVTLNNKELNLHCVGLLWD